MPDKEKIMQAITNNFNNDYWEMIMNSSLRGFVNQLDAMQLSRFRTRHLEQIKTLKTDKGNRLDINIIFFGARKPA